MGTFRSALSAFSVVPAVLLALLAPALPAAHAQANLTFSGGSGSLLTITLASPVSYTVTTGGSGPFFLFKNVGNLFGSPGGSGVVGTITYKINNGSATAIDSLSSGVTVGPAAASDVFLDHQPFPSLSAGDIVTLTAGTLTTVAPTSITPTNGSFTTFLLNSTGSAMSGNGTSISSTAAPEPGSAALLAFPALGGIGAIGASLRRRNP